MERVSRGVVSLVEYLYREGPVRLTGLLCGEGAEGCSKTSRNCVERVSKCAVIPSIPPNVSRE